MAYSRGSFKTTNDIGCHAEADLSRHSNRNVIYIPGSLGIERLGQFSPWASRQRFTPQSRNWYRTLADNPESIFLSGEHSNSVSCTNDDLQKSKINMPPPIPQWIWTVLVTILGIGPETSQERYRLSTVLYISTITSALLFGVSGLFFNVYNARSGSTKSSFLGCVCTSILGLYWIGIGTYANILAIRLFSNQRMVDCIRLHSKTFLKVSTAFIVMLLSVTVVIVNLYSNIHLLKDQKPENGTNCCTMRVSVNLCRIYFSAKVIYSSFCLMWNLLVVGIFLSVCRTHTISIRRFMKQLLCDIKIYVEFLKIRALEKQVENMQSTSMESRQNQQQATVFHDISESNIWDDDILGIDQDTGSSSEPTSNDDLLQMLQIIRINTNDLLARDLTSNFHGQEVMGDFNTGRTPGSNTWINEEENQSLESASSSSQLSNEDIKQQASSPDHFDFQEPPAGLIESDENQKQQTLQPDPTNVSAKQAGEAEKVKLKKERSTKAQTQTNTSQPRMLRDLAPPLMSNEELFFTYFLLLRRLSSTSRLLQRWMFNWIAFVLLWCGSFIVYWSKHDARLVGIIQFLVPLVTLMLLTSGYAEVNFEGERLIKCVLPTDERMSIFYYFHNTKLELKIFSFTMSYNTILTVVAGIAVTFATRIILDEFSVLNKQ